MGGGQNDFEVIVCQMCEMHGHSSSECKWVYNKCKKGVCEGLMIMQYISTKGKLWEKILTMPIPNLWLMDLV